MNMCKVLIKCVFFLGLSHSSLLITQKIMDEAAKTLWTLSGIAIQSQQNATNLGFQSTNFNATDETNEIIDGRNNLKYVDQYYKGYPQMYRQDAFQGFNNKYPSGNLPPYQQPNFNQYSQYYQNQIPFPSPGNNIRPGFVPPGGPFPPLPPPPIPPTQSLMDAIYSIAQYDDLRCVPRLLCELTSGTNLRRQSSFNIPSIINMDSLLGFLSAFDVAGMPSNPLLSFGRAALLGYNSRGNARSCSYAYPKCPQDPNQLVTYLNNHNGGFFRYFNGVNPNAGNPQLNYDAQSHQYPYAQNYVPPNTNYGYVPNRFPPYRPQNQQPNDFQKRYQSTLSDINRHPNGYYHRHQKGAAQQRIQTKPGLLVASSNANKYVTNGGNRYTWKFPLPNDDTLISDGKRKFKSIKFSEKHTETFPPFNKKHLTQIPNYHLNQHSISVFFPDRTGTGDLLLDSEKFITPVAVKDTRTQREHIFYMKHFEENNWNPTLHGQRTKTVKFPSTHEGRIYND